MSKTSTLAIKSLREAIENAISTAISKGALPEGELNSFIIEAPADRSHGDFATNAAMTGARVFRMPPFKIAEAIKENINLEGTVFEKCEVAGAGFINFFLSPKYFADVIEEITSSGESFGRSDFGGGKKINVEFVSANPTGPMHMGNARGGALGDCLAAVLDAAGYEVQREFYVNDAGNQIEKFASSLNARYMQIFDPEFIMPEDGYQGEDIKDLAKEFEAVNGDSFVNKSEAERKTALVDFALPKNIAKMQADEVQILLSLPIGKKVKKELVEIEQYLKEECERAYLANHKKSIWLLRGSRYWLYVVGAIAFRIMKG